MDTAIGKANERLNFVSQDKEFLRAYHLREMAMSDITTAVNTGIMKNRIEIAKNLLQMKLTVEQIQEATGLDAETIRSIS